MADAWGMDVHGPDHARNDELGWTCDEDADDWGPADIRIVAPVTRALFALTFLYAGLSMVRTFVCRASVHRRGRSR